MRSNCIGAKGMSFLVSTYAVRNLTAINVSKCNLGDEGFKQICGASYMSNLHKLVVDEN